MEFLNRNDAINQVTGYIEEKTRIPRTIQLSILVAVTVLWLLFGYGAALLCNVISFIYPAYKSIEAIETAAKEDDTQWLMYWTIFGFFTCVDKMLIFLLGKPPFYFLLKSIFLIWCYLPIQHNGSMILYNRVVLELFIRYHQQIEEMIGAAGRPMAAVIEILAKIGKGLAEAGKGVTGKLAESGKETATRMAEAGREAISKAAKNGKEVVAKVEGKLKQSSTDAEPDISTN